MAQSPDDRNDKDVDSRSDSDGPGRNLPRLPSQEDAAHPGEKCGECVSRDSMRRCVVAERRHSSLIVADSLQREAERRACNVKHGEIGNARPEKREVVEGNRAAPIDTEKHGRQNAVESGKTVENRIVLTREIEERGSDRERDHDRVYAFGSHREPARESAERDGDAQRNRDRNIPRPAQRDAGDRAWAQYRQQVSRAPGDRHLGKTDHPAVATQKNEAEGNYAENE